MGLVEFRRMIETYPKADGHWIWLAEIGCPGTNDPETQTVLGQYEVPGKRPYSDSDLALGNFCNDAGPSPVGMPYLDPFKQAAPPGAKSAILKRRPGCVTAIPRLRAALGHMERARPKVLAGAQHELDYVVFKTQSRVLHLQMLCAMLFGRLLSLTEDVL